VVLGGKVSFDHDHDAPNGDASQFVVHVLPPSWEAWTKNAAIALLLSDDCRM